MRKKSFSVTLVALLTLSLLSSANASTSSKAIKIGASCKKVGITSKVGNSILICTKSNSKLIWQSKSTKPESSASASPSPTKAPTPIESLSPTQNSQNIFRNNGPKTDAGRAAAKPIYEALNQVAKDLYIRSLEVPKASLKIYSDEPNNSLINVIYPVIIRTTEMMRAIAPDYQNNELYIFRKISWLEQSNLKDLCPHILMDQSKYGWANSGCFKYWSGDLGYYEDKTWYINKLRHSPITLFGYTGAHESVHLLQTGNMNSNWNRFPSWYREGSATVGAGLVMVTFSEFANGNYEAVDDWENNSWSKQRCKDVYDMWKIENETMGHGLTKNCEQSVGRRMIEYLVAHDGKFDNIRTVFDNVGPNLSFEEAFEKYHGIKLKDFFAEVETWLERLDWSKAKTY